MNKKIILAAIFVITTTLFQTCFAAEKKTITVGVQDFTEYLPYSEYKDGEYKGFNRELLDMFGASKGYTFVYEPFPVSRLYEAFLNGEVDIKDPDNPYWSKDQKAGKDIKYSDPIVEYIDGVMVLPENKGKGLANLKKLGIISGFTPFAYLQQIKSGAVNTTDVVSYDSLLKQVIMKKADGAYSNIAVSRHYLESSIKNVNALVFDPKLPHTRSKRHISSIKYPEVITEFNAFLKDPAFAEKIKALKGKYRVEEGL